VSRYLKNGDVLVFDRMVLSAVCCSSGVALSPCRSVRAN